MALKKDHTTLFMRTLGILFLILTTISILCYNFSKPKHSVPIVHSNKVHYYPKGMI